MSSFRRTLAVLATFTITAIVIFLSYSGEQIVPQPSKHVQLKLLVDNHSYLLDTPGCRIPEWDPYDPSVLPFYEKVHVAYQCPGKPHFLLSRPNASVHLDKHVLNFHYGIETDNLSCSYVPILRDPGPQNHRTDDRFTFGDSKTLEFDTPLGVDFIRITCNLGHLPNFTQYMALVPLKSRHAKENSHSEAQDKLNIIIVGIDSVSKLNFLRHFRKTHSFMKENFAPIELKGYTKVADNTFPNLVPFLTGNFIERYWNESMRGMFFDHLDFIWKNYSAKGYWTLFSEDAPGIATFNYLKKGFKNPPADFYFRPFALAVEESKVKRLSKIHCFQSQLEMEVLYTYLKDFVSTMDHRPHFAFTFVARLTHDKLNAAGYADEPTFRLLRSLHDNGALNRSLVILFSDHGIRFGPIRQTYIGKFEERMPFIYLLFPQWFLDKHSDYATLLRQNQNRLTTPFDIHATLVHLLDLEESANSTIIPDESNGIGISLFKDIPENRTCAEAGILPHWCPCQTHAKLSVSDPLVVSAAAAILNTINDWLKPFANSCVKLRLDAILDARIGQASDLVLRFVKHMNDVIGRHVVLGDKIHAPSDYLIIVRVLPSAGVFEGTVRYDELEGTFKVLDEISRINRYGNQSSCIMDSRIRKYCFCRTNQTNSNKKDETENHT